MGYTIVKEVFFNRNILLILAIFGGFFFGEYAYLTKDYIYAILVIIMIFSTTGISTRSMFPLKKTINPMLSGILLNYFIFGFVLIALAYVLMPSKELFYGFVVIAATPPGVVIIPFTVKSRGDISHSSLGVLGGFLASVVLTPLILNFFTSSESINPLDIVVLMIKLVIIPLLISRILILPKLKKTIDKVKGRIIDYSFAIIIFTAVGMNSEVFQTDISSLILPSLVLFLSIFVLGALFYFIPLTNSVESTGISNTLLLTIKSSGFAVVTSVELFGKIAAIPAALLSIFVLLFLITFSVFQNVKKSYTKKTPTEIKTFKS